MNRKRFYGKIVADIQGYKVRQLVERVDGISVPTGKYAIYRGKKKRLDHNSYPTSEKAIAALKDFLS